jgi:hypothetical protein
MGNGLMAGHWQEMLGLADAVQVPMEMKFGGIKQSKACTFKVKGTEFLYRMKLIHGYVSPDYETAACVFHVGGDGYLLVEKMRRTLDFRMLNLEGGDLLDLVPKSKNPRAVIKAAKRFEVCKIGTRSIEE